MPSNKETLFQAHICQFLATVHGYKLLDKALLPNQTDHIIEPLLLAFIKNTQADKFASWRVIMVRMLNKKLSKPLKRP